MTLILTFSKLLTIEFVNMKTPKEYTNQPIDKLPCGRCLVGLVVRGAYNVVTKLLVGQFENIFVSARG